MLNRLSPWLLAVAGAVAGEILAWTFAADQLHGPLTLLG